MLRRLAKNKPKTPPDDLFSAASKKTSHPAKPKRAKKAAGSKSGENGYTAADIEVLEGLEPVRRHPAMYIGSTDEKGLHHLFAEVLDNAMDEAVAGYASWIEIELDKGGWLSVSDNGRGIPIDPHPKFKDKSALEIIMTTLHAGGKFDSGVYETSGGLHGVGVSVVNALSACTQVEVARNQQLYTQSYKRGIPDGPLKKAGKIHNRRGTRIRFLPDEKIFGKIMFKPPRLYRMARSKAYLFGGVKIRWSCDPSLIGEKDETPEKDTLHFPGGLKDYLDATIKGCATVTPEPFCGKLNKEGAHGSLEWAIAWYGGGDGFLNSYCNTVPTPEGGTHESGFRAGLTKALKAYAEMTGNKKGAIITGEDVLASAGGLLSVFIREPEFQGQTKEKLVTVEAARLVEAAIRDHFDHWLTGARINADKLLDWVIGYAEERLKRRQDREVSRKTAARKLRLPGKLADCSSNAAGGSELFIVEGDSAGGSAKQARNRKTQAVLPLRGKILNVVSAAAGKMAQNQQIHDLIQALGCRLRSDYREQDLRYEKIIIMTDADVDGAHIASLLISFFFQEMPDLICNGHLYLAMPPLYRLNQGGKILYAHDDQHKDELLETEFNSKGKIDISRFKGLGEMMPAQLKETAMNPETRTLVQVRLNDDERQETSDIVNSLMGNRPEARFAFIQKNAGFARALDI